MMPIPLAPDILVIGGGSAGIAAALSAAAAGAVTVLVERNAFIGGIATAAWVGTVCGLYYQDAAAPTNCCGGFPAEFCFALSRRDDLHPVKNPNGLWFLPCRPATFAAVSERYISESSVSLLCLGTVSAATKTEDRVASVTVLIGSDFLSFSPGAVVDCSGDSVISRLIGDTVILPDNYQANAIVFELHGKEYPDPRTCMLYLLAELQRGVTEGILPESCQRLSILPGHASGNSLLVKLNLPPRDLSVMGMMSEIESEARSLVPAIVDHINRGSTPLASSSLGAIAPQVGFRSGRRLNGHTKLSRSDVESCLTDTEFIARGTWPIEEWLDHRRPTMTYLTKGTSYGIPAGSLSSKSTRNLFAAGRSISADDGANASTRVIGTCLQTGWAAGKLAVGSLMDGDEDPKRLLVRIRGELELE